MNEKWSLDVLYTGMDSTQFRKDFETMQGLCKELAAYAELPIENTAAYAKEYLALSERISALSFNLDAYAGLRHEADTNDTEAASFMGRLGALMGGMAGADAAIQIRLANCSDLEDAVASDTELKCHSYYFQKLRRKAAHLLQPGEEAIIARMALSGGSAWSQLHGALTSSLEVPFRNGTETLSGIRNLAYSADADERKEAYEAELKAYRKVEDSLAYALNSIKLETVTECELRRYESALARSLEQSNMKQATLDALFSAIDDYMPQWRRYQQLKARALGHENGLPWYDLFAPMGSNVKKYSTEDARDTLLRIFGGVDRELHDMVARAFEESWIDFFPRPGKVGGAFCEMLYTQKQSRILTNFGGEFGDVVTLAHELGHAFHNVMLQDHDMANHDLPMPLAETASTFNENLLVSEALKAAETRDEKLALVESQLMDANQVICDIYSRFLFEKAVIESRSDRFMPAQELCEMMLDAQRKTYGDGLDPKYMHPYMWACKGHYYSSGLSFYNFPYAFGGLFARSLYAMYAEQGTAFIPKYKELLRATTIMDAEDAAAICGADITDKAFWAAGLESYKEEIDLFEELLNPQ